MNAWNEHSSRTLTASHLIAILSKVHPDTPVVMMQCDEPSGVRDAEVRQMKRDSTYRSEPFGKDVWFEESYLNQCPDSRRHARFDSPQDVVFLGDESPRMPVVDGEVGQAELMSGLGQP